jgi:hypothetical protein
MQTRNSLTLWNPNVYCRVHKIPPLEPALIQINLIHTSILIFLRFILLSSSHLRLGLPSRLFPPYLHYGWSAAAATVALLSCSRYKVSERSGPIVVYFVRLLGVRTRKLWPWTLTEDWVSCVLCTMRIKRMEIGLIVSVSSCLNVGTGEPIGGFLWNLVCALYHFKSHH